MSEAGEREWVTQVVSGRFWSELDECSGSVRVEITKKIGLARREGDSEEDGGYHTVCDEQVHNETRTLELQRILKHVEVSEVTNDGTISPDYVVEAKVGKRKIRFLLGSRVADEGTNIDVFSLDAPLGAVLLGHREGDQMEYLAPTGRKIQVEVFSASALEGQANRRDGHTFPL